MHIPDGYLSPQTCIAAFAVAVPILAVASRQVGKVVRTRNVPMLAVMSALSFLIMMFNVPIPDGTTAHAVGGVIIAICLGPWAAIIAVAVALLFQALLFGDGGVLAYGANVLNMAIILPVVAIVVYRLISGKAPLLSRRRVVAAAVAGYVGINAAAFAAAVEFGIQPDLFHTANGTPLYSPYHLSQSIPAMMIAHLTVAGAAEAILTAGILAYLQRADVARLIPNHPGVPVTAAEAQPSVGRLSPTKVAVGFMVAMVALTPLGLLAPGGAFGEDSPSDLDLGGLGLSTVPAGLEKYNGLWSHAVLGDYGFASGDNPVLAYLVSALVGIVVVTLVVFVIGKAVGRTLAGRGAASGPSADSITPAAETTPTNTTSSSSTHA